MVNNEKRTQIRCHEWEQLLIIELIVIKSYNLIVSENYYYKAYNIRILTKL